MKQKFSDSLRPLLPNQASLTLAFLDSLRMGSVTQIEDLDTSSYGDTFDDTNV